MFQKIILKIRKRFFWKKSGKYFPFQKSMKLIFQKINFIDFYNGKYFFDIFFKNIFRIFKMIFWNEKIEVGKKSGHQYRCRKLSGIHF